MVVYRIDPETMETHSSPFYPVDAILDSVGVYPSILNGPPGDLKSPCAESAAALQSKGNDMSECAVTSDGMKASIQKKIETHFSDFTLGDNMPRIVTCQSLAKLLPGFKIVDSGTGMRDIIDLVGNEDDTQAVFKRFVQKKNNTHPKR